MGSERRTCFETQCIMALQGHPRSLILAPIESSYPISYWSSVVTLVLSCSVSEIGPIAGFLLRTTPPLFRPNFRGVSFGLDCRCCGSEFENPKLIIRVINFELVQTICPRYINVTDRQTDGRMIYDSNTAAALALRASRGNN